METQTEKNRRESKIMNEAMPFLKAHRLEKILRLTIDPNRMDMGCMVAQIMGDYYESRIYEKWISVNERLPDNLSYHILEWELPHPEREQETVKGVRSRMCEIYKDKKWYGENNVQINGVTRWMPFPEPTRVV